jgi:eukaryotic-like serine/threonine-protein kinase
MPLSAGDKLGPYEILAPIGAGGMGEVYKALDTRLDRIVALKTSKTEFSERFEREARAVAALNHPNICTLHDVGPNYLVMEYIEGTPVKGPLPLDQALQYAAQICDALDAAHTKSITHRDLKPPNILVTKQGIKLLDFGLAKVGPVVRADEATMTMALTGKGEILGTLMYMSPEQISGQEADARSDIFSFGLVLYEMLTGKRAFEGSTPASVMGAILERPAPSIAEVGPQRLDRVLKRCLEKDPDNRWQSARDIKASFDLIAPVTGEHAAVRAPGPKKLLWGVAVVLALAVAAFVGVQYVKAKPAAARQVVRFQIPVQPAAGLRPIAAIAPDGLSLAYFDTFADGHTAIKIRAMDSGIATEFPASEMAQPTYMFWSPDSKTIFFGNRRFLKRMDVSRRTVQQICDCSSDSGAVNQDGVILLGGSPVNPAITRISTAGETTTLHKAARTEVLPSSPVFLPDGRRFLFAEGGGIFLSSLDQPRAEVRRVGDGPDRFTLVRGSSGSFFLLRQSSGGTDVLPFDVQKGEIAGPPLALPLAAVEQTTPSVSNTGILLRLLQVETRQVAVWFDRQGKRLGEAGVTEGYSGIDLSPDGGRLALISPVGFWVRDLERGTATRLAQQVQASGSAIWSPDGMSLVFAANDKTRVQRLYRADASNTRPEALLLDEPGLHWPNDWSRDGKYLLYGFDEGKTYRDLWVLRMDEPGAKPSQYTHGASLIKQGQFSPDGRFVAYTSDEAGRYEIYVQPFPDASKGKWVISQAGGVGPLWSRDGRELFFFSGQKMMVVDVRANGGPFSASAPRELFSAQVPAGFSNDSHRWQLSPDGKRFLVMVPSSGASSAYLDIVVNWETLLKQ